MMEIRQIKDTVARRAMGLVAIGVLSATFLVGFGLYWRARPVLAGRTWSDVLFSASWHPAQGQFGLGGFILGSLWVTAIAMVIAVPLSLLTALYLSEYASRRIRELAHPVVDVLAGISPVVYGVWGMLVVVPLVRDYAMPFLSSRLKFFPFSSDNFTGFSALAGGVVLAVMVVPIMISVMEEVLRTVPPEIREASLALGATRWQTTKKAVLKKAWPGVVAAIILGFSRASGETMAVLMVAGCAMQTLPKSIFDPAYPLPALIANTYGEMMSVPLYDAAILLAAFVLFLLTVFFNAVGWGILLRLEKREG
jgi:phosphate transport system permease protein